MAIASSTSNPVSVPNIDRTLCTNCGDCANICPSQTLVWDGSSVQVDQLSAFGCIGCGHCMAVCPVDAVAVAGRDISPSDMLPLPALDSAAAAEQLSALMLRRRSMRHFQERELARELVERVLELTATAPMGIPPSEVGVVVFHGRDKVRAFAEVAQGAFKPGLWFLKSWIFKLMALTMKPAQRETMRTFIIPLYEKLTEGWQEGKDLLFYNAPAALLFHTSPYAEATDTAIAATFAMLAAESLGLGTVMIGAASPMLKQNKAALEQLGIPAGHTPGLVLLMGHPAAGFRKAIRRRLVSVKYA